MVKFEFLNCDLFSVEKRTFFIPLFCYNTVQHKSKYGPRIAAVSRTQNRHKSQRSFIVDLCYRYQYASRGFKGTCSSTSLAEVLMTNAY